MSTGKGTATSPAKKVTPISKEVKEAQEIPVTLGKNVAGTLKGHILTLSIDLSQDFGPSDSGKTNRVATTNGNIPVPGYEDVDVKVGINVFRKVNK